MRVQQVDIHKWELYWTMPWQFVQYMWVSVLEGFSGHFNAEMAYNFSINIKNEPLSEFNFDQKLKDMCIKELGELATFLKGNPSRFMISVDSTKQCCTLQKY